MLLYTKTPYFQQLLGSIHNGMIFYNIEGRMYAVNSAALELFGLSETEAMAMHWDQLFARVDQSAELNHFLRALRQEDRVDPIQLRYQSANGRTYYLDLSMSLLIEYEKVFGILLILSDHTELVEAHRRELEVLEESAHKMNNLSSAIAHQIRNPLQVIGGFNQIVRRKLSGKPDVGPFLDGIAESAARLGTVVDGVTAVTSLKSGDLELCSLLSVLESIRSQWIQSKDEQGRSISWNMTIDDVFMNIDRVLLGMALAKVFDNTLDFRTNENVFIEILAKVVSGWVEIDITDNGPGVAVDHIHYVFDPFFTTKAVGVGMGLCVADRAVQSMSGAIHLESNGSQGTRIKVRFPVDSSKGSKFGV